MIILIIVIIIIIIIIIIMIVTGSNNKIIYDINNKDIYRKPKRKQTNYRNALKTMHENVDAVH